MEDMVIALDGFTKSYSGSIPAVEDFTLHCKRGSVTGLLGLNGAGKTTILKAVCARHFASRGTVTVCGINAVDEPERVRLLTGFVSEQSRFPGGYGVLDYLTLRGKLYGLGGKELSEAKKRVIEQCALEDVLYSPLRTLSKGFAERVNFAQALLHNPPVLVLDEPASGLDPAQIVRMRALIKSLLPDHTILLSTHLMQEVHALCDSVAILHKGRSLCQGLPDDIVRQTGRSTLEEAFFALTAGEAVLQTEIDK